MKENIKPGREEVTSVTFRMSKHLKIQFCKAFTDCDMLNTPVQQLSL